METLVRLFANELNASFIEFIKKSFEGKRIAVHIYEDNHDETAFLFNAPIAKERLL